MGHKPPRKARVRKATAKPLNAFGEVLHDFRVDLEISEEELAARSHLSRTTIQNSLVSATKIFRRARLDSLINALNLVDEGRESLVEAWDRLPGWDLEKRFKKSAKFDEQCAAWVREHFPEASPELVAALEAGEWRQLAKSPDSPVDGHPYDWLTDRSWPVANPQFARSWFLEFPWHAKTPRTEAERAELESRFAIALDVTPTPELVAELMPSETEDEWG